MIPPGSHPFKGEALTPHMPVGLSSQARDQKESMASGIRAWGLGIDEMAVEHFGLTHLCRDNISEAS
jgi:hypothetical protein